MCRDRVSSTKNARSHGSRKLTIIRRLRVCVYVPLSGTKRNGRKPESLRMALGALISSANYSRKDRRQLPEFNVTASDPAVPGCVQLHTRRAGSSATSCAAGGDTWGSDRCTRSVSPKHETLRLLAGGNAGTASIRSTRVTPRVPEPRLRRRRRRHSTAAPRHISPVTRRHGEIASMATNGPTHSRHMSRPSSEPWRCRRWMSGSYSRRWTDMDEEAGNRRASARKNREYSGLGQGTGLSGRREPGAMARTPRPVTAETL